MKIRCYDWLIFVRKAQKPDSGWQMVDKHPRNVPCVPSAAAILLPYKGKSKSQEPRGAGNMELRCLSICEPREKVPCHLPRSCRALAKALPPPQTSWGVPDQYSCTIFSLAADNSQSGAVADLSQELKSLRHHKR